MFGKDQAEEAKKQAEEAKKQAEEAKKQAEELFKEGEQGRLEDIAILEKKIREHVTNT
jgi:membrane protein involved in colicin uptake